MFKLHRFAEHHQGFLDFEIPPEKVNKFFFGKDKYGIQRQCLIVNATPAGTSLEASYYIGIDWLDQKNAIHIRPKIDDEDIQTDYLGMLSSCLKHPEIFAETKDLFKIKFNEPFIPIDKSDDLLTPLLIIQFLGVLEVIVTKGLRKSYYRVENRLKAGVKGKIDMVKTTRSNLKSETMGIHCNYDEFGNNTQENRLLKKTLTFIQQYVVNHISSYGNIQHIIRKCNSAFQSVSDDFDLTSIRNVPIHSIYKEYEEAIRLGQLILRRFGYSIRTTGGNSRTKIPPFWIDMSKLFELYVLGLLKDRFGKNVDYHFSSRWNELDYLLNDPNYKMVIDAKYKVRYQKETGSNYRLEDVRQLSGYARLNAVYDELNLPTNQLIDCLIIYPDRNASMDLPIDLKEGHINGFQGFYKVAVRLPEVSSL
ncbi:MAG: hypothetical protein ABJQ69_03740 [Ekhidna sp.]